MIRSFSNNRRIADPFKPKEAAGFSLKELRMLVWLTQMGLNVCTPLVGCTFLSLWLRQRFGLGIWIVLIGLAVGLAGAANGLRLSLKAADRMTRDQKSNHK